MTLEEFKRRMRKAERELMYYGGVCGALGTSQGFKVKKKFADILKPTLVEASQFKECLSLDGYTSIYWLGKPYGDKIDRYIALGLFEQICIDEKLYLEF